MRTAMSSALLFVATGLFTAAAVAEEPLLEEGSYEVAVSLALPHVDNVDFKKSVTICVTAATGGNRGLTVLSGHDLFGHCPVTDAQLDGDTLTFRYICAGSNAPEARAKYVLSPRDFRGRIDIKMGGKNMTMIEKQHGHRTGACEQPPRS